MWQLRSRTLELGQRTMLMAIVNLTPDSFSGDGLNGRGTEAAVQRACALLEVGGDILDLGAESTRPGAQPIGAGEEQDRLLPVLEGILRAAPAAICSVDTYHAATAKQAAKAGAEIVNDVSGMKWDDEMAGVLAEVRCGAVLMHAQGRPAEWSTMERLGRQHVVHHVTEGLRASLDAAKAAGIRLESIVLDPGFGFGKFGAENFTLLAQMQGMQSLGRPLLAGLSRKGFLGEVVKPLQARHDPNTPINRLRFYPTLAGNVAAVLAGAHVLRVHDLAETREAVTVVDAILAAAAE